MEKVDIPNTQTKMKEVIAKYGRELSGRPRFKPLRQRPRDLKRGSLLPDPDRGEVPPRHAGANKPTKAGPTRQPGGS